MGWSYGSWGGLPHRFAKELMEVETVWAAKAPENMRRYTLRPQGRYCMKIAPYNTANTILRKWLKHVLLFLPP